MLRLWLLLWLLWLWLRLWHSAAVQAYQPFTPDLYKRPKVEVVMGGRPRGEDGRRRLIRIMNARGRAYDCYIPLEATEGSEDNLVISQDPTFDIAARHEEDLRARAMGLKRGIDLLQGMDQSCLYYVQGWWTYAFCYSNTILQFHQLPPADGLTLEYPPKPDPKSESFTLSVFPKELTSKDTLARLDASANSNDQDKREKGKPEPRKGMIEVKVDQNDWSIGAEVVARPDSTPFLAQRWGDGTICQETGLPRITEIQFRCQPGSIDRVVSVRETSTCIYLIVIHTNRLCEAEIFRAKPEEDPSPIYCETSGDEGDVGRKEPFVLDGRLSMEGQPEDMTADISYPTGGGPPIKIIGAPTAHPAAQVDGPETLANKLTSDLQARLDAFMKKIGNVQEPSQDLAKAKEAEGSTDLTNELVKIRSFFYDRGLEVDKNARIQEAVSLGLLNYIRAPISSTAAKMEEMNKIARAGQVEDVRTLAILALGLKDPTLVNESLLNPAYLDAHLAQARSMADRREIAVMEGSLWDEITKVIHARAHFHLSQSKTKENPTAEAHIDL